MEIVENGVATDVDTKMRMNALLVHALYAAGILTGITTLVGVVLAYMRKGDASGTIYEGHFVYAIRTFWWCLVFSVIGFVLSFVGIGFVILLATGVFYIIRVVRAFILWSDRKPFKNPKAFI